MDAKDSENDSVDRDRFQCESAFLYLPGLVRTVSMQKKKSYPIVFLREGTVIPF